jgi:hypothetical protein
MEGQIVKLKEKLSLQKCRAALGTSNTTYSDADILAIRDYLYELAEVDYEVFVYNEWKEQAEQSDPENNNLSNAA